MVPAREFPGRNREKQKGAVGSELSKKWEMHMTQPAKPSCRNLNSLLPTLPRSTVWHTYTHAMSLCCPDGAKNPSEALFAHNTKLIPLDWPYHLFIARFHLECFINSFVFTLQWSFICCMYHATFFLLYGLEGIHKNIYFFSLLVFTIITLVPVPGKRLNREVGDTGVSRQSSTWLIGPRVCLCAATNVQLH